MTSREEVGRLGEKEAASYLLDKGYKILEKNHRQPWGELDIVARAPDRALVFVEVKAGGGYPFEPEENLTRAKLRKLQRTASLYANSHQKLIDDRKGWRIDLVAIELGRDGPLDIRHYENI